jgi:ERF superfamily
VSDDGWKPKGAAAKLAYIQTHIANPDKTGRNDFHKFDYIQEHGLIELLRPMLRELHCAVVPSPAAHEVRIEDGKTPKGRDQKMVTLVGEIRFIDTDEPFDSLDREQAIRVTAGGADDLDKAHAKAQTILVKYGLQKLFLIPTEKIEDGDADGETPPRSKPSSRTESPAKAETPPVTPEPASVAEDGSQDGASRPGSITDEQLEGIASLYREKGWTKQALVAVFAEVGAEGRKSDELSEDQASWVLIRLAKGPSDG